MNLDQIMTLIVLALMVVTLLAEWLPVGLVGIMAPLVLVLTGTIESQTMWSGLSQPAVIAVAGMFVVSAAVSRTGALGFIGDSFAHLGRSGMKRILGPMMLVVAVLSAFINNTTVVLVMIPVVLTMCERLKQAPSRFLIPLSFASIFGGLVTLVGTSTNVVIAEAGRAAVEEFAPGYSFAPGMWAFTPVGVILLCAGVLYMVTLGQRLLPRRGGLTVPLGRGVPSEYVTEVEILPGSGLSGRTIADIQERFHGLRVLQVIRDDVILPPAGDLEIRENDVLLVKGRASDIVEIGTGGGASLLPDVSPKDVRTRDVNTTLAEVIVPPGSRWVGRPVKEIGFRSRYGVSVIAVQRHGHHVRQKVGDLRVEPADIILLQGPLENLRNLRVSDNLILIEGVGKDIKLKSRAPLALVGLVLFVGLISTGLLHVATAAVLSATFVVLAGCITLKEAFDSVDWNVIFILAGSLVLGDAVNRVGLDAMAAEGIKETIAGLPPSLVVAVFFGLAAFLTDLITNGAAAALLVPLAVQTAVQLETSPEPVLMAVAYGASSAFLTPIGYQTNLLVYAPGGYRFRDFLRVGLPLRILFWILVAVFVPLFHPL